MQELRQRRARAVWTDLVFGPVDDEGGLVDARRQLPNRGLVQSGGARIGRDQRLRVGVEPPRDAVLDLLGRVRFGEDLGDEELQEVLVVLEPVVPVELLPAVVCLPWSR